MCEQLQPCANKKVNAHIGSHLLFLLEADVARKTKVRVVLFTWTCVSGTSYSCLSTATIQKLWQNDAAILASVICARWHAHDLCKWHKSTRTVHPRWTLPGFLLMQIAQGYTRRCFRRNRNLYSGECPNLPIPVSWKRIGRIQDTSVGKKELLRGCQECIPVGFCMTSSRRHVYSTSSTTTH